MPIALRMVYEVCQTVSVPVIGLGGIATANDALAFIMAGASAIQVGTATFANPHVMQDILDGMESWMQANGVQNIAEIRGAAQ